VGANAGRLPQTGCDTLRALGLLAGTLADSPGPGRTGYSCLGVKDSNPAVPIGQRILIPLEGRWEPAWEPMVPGLRLSAVHKLHWSRRPSAVSGPGGCGVGLGPVWMMAIRHKTAVNYLGVSSRRQAVVMDQQEWP
jgi:hypothetical protein